MRPFVVYAACNWYEHLKMSADSVRYGDFARDNALMFDISKPQFWVWFLIACDQTCLSRSITSESWRDEPVTRVWAEAPSFGNMDRGVFLRKMCLQKLCPMSAKVGALFFDDATPTDTS